MRIPSTLLIAICTIITSIGNVFAAQVDPILAHAMPIVRTADGDTIPCFSIKIQPVILNGQQEPLCPNYGVLTIVAVDSLTGDQIPNLSYTWFGESIINSSTDDTSFIAIIPHLCNFQYEVHLSVTDTLNGCTASTTYTVDVRDTIPPVVQDGVLENRKVLPTSEGKYYIPDFTSLLTYGTVSDNCYPFSTLTINQNPAAGTEFSETTMVTITLSGPCEDENPYFVQVAPWALDTICFPNTSCSGYPNATLGINHVPIGFSCTFQNSTRLSDVQEGSLAIENTIIFDFCQIGVWPLQITDLYGNTVEYSVTIRESLNYPGFGINEILVTQPTSSTSFGQIIINTVAGFSYTLTNAQQQIVSSNNLPEGTYTLTKTSLMTGCATDTVIYIVVEAIESDGQPCPGASTVTDIDGNVYNTVQIGAQCWMKENLRVTHYADGTNIPDGDCSSITTTTTDPYYYINTNLDAATYGYYYNWPAAMHGAASSNANPSNVQGVCPTGWHLPSDAEWSQLTNYVSGQSEYICGGNSNNIAKALASETGWWDYSDECTPGDQSISANNATGFSAVPTDNCYGPTFEFAGATSFWSSTEGGPDHARTRYMSYTIAAVPQSYSNKYNGRSVRCLRDSDGGTSQTQPTVTTSPATAVTATSATCGGEVTSDGGATVTARGVCWSTSPNPTVSDNHTTDGSGVGLFTSNITGLVPNTLYYARAYAINSEGTAYGEQETFTTVDSVPAADAAITAMATPVMGECPQSAYNISITIANMGLQTLNFAMNPAVATIISDSLNLIHQSTISSGCVNVMENISHVVATNVEIPVNHPIDMTFIIRTVGDENFSNDTLRMEFTLEVAKPEYDETFSNGPQKTWTIQQTSTGSKIGNWTFQEGNGADPTIAPVYGTGRLFFNAKDFQSGTSSRAIMPVIDLSDAYNPVLEIWFAHDNSYNKPLEGVTVKISTDGCNTFSDLVPQGASTSLLRRYSALAFTPMWIRYTYDLSAYVSSGCVHIAFDAYGRAGRNINIDRVRLRNLYDNDIAVTHIYSMGETPAQYNLDGVVKARVRNEGRQTQNNVKVYLNVVGSVEQYHDSLTIPTIAPGEEKIVIFPQHHYNVLEVTDVEVCSRNDQDNSNNSAHWRMEVTHNIANYSDTSAVDLLTGDYTNVIRPCVRYRTTDGLIVTAVKYYYDQTYIADPEEGFRAFVSNAAGDIVATSEIINFNQLQQGAWNIIPIVNSDLTNMQDLYVGIEMMAHGDYLCSQREFPLRDSTFYYLNNGTYVPQYFGRFMIGAVFDTAYFVDLNILSMLNPTTRCNLGLEQIKVKITNNSIVDIPPGLKFHYRVNGHPAVSQTLSDTLFSHQTTTFVFYTPFDFTNNQFNVDENYNIKVWVTKIAFDPLQFNDTLELTIQSMGKSVTPVLAQDTVLVNYSTAGTLTASLPDSSTQGVLGWFTSNGYENWELKGYGNSYTTPPTFFDTVYYVNANTGQINDTIVGNDTLTGTQPFVFNRGYSRGKILYRSDEIGHRGTITQIGLYVNTAADGTDGIPIRIYMKKTADVMLPTAATQVDWAAEISSASLVVDRRIQFSPTGWYYIDLDVPFEFDAGNLLVYTETNCADFCTGTGPMCSTCAQAVSGSNVLPSFWQTNTGYGYVLYKSGNSTASLTGNYSVYSRRLNMYFNIADLHCASEKIPVYVHVPDIPRYDVQTISMDYPTTGCALYDEHIQVTIKNMLNVPIPAGEVNVHAVINGSTTLTETINEIILPKEVKTVTFSQPYDFSAPHNNITFDYVIYTTMNNEQIVYTLNDTVSGQLTSIYTTGLQDSYTYEGNYMDSMQILQPDDRLPDDIESYYFFDSSGTLIHSTLPSAPYYTTPELHDSVVFLIAAKTKTSNCMTRRVPVYINVEVPTYVIDDKSCPAAPTVTDHEGNIYPTVQIGNQCWMRDNLRTTTSPSTGTYLIPAANVGDTYTGKQARWYNNDSATYAPMNYGLLYNWNAAVDTFNTAFGETNVNITSSNAVSVSFTGHRRGICPAGWHLPSDAEWMQLTDYVSSYSEYTCSGNSNFIAKALASMEWWISFGGECYPGDQSHHTNNATGFSSVPAGFCSDSSFYDAGNVANFWSSTEFNSYYAYNHRLFYSTAYVGRYYGNQVFGFSVRCLRDPDDSTDTTQTSLPTVSMLTFPSNTADSIVCSSEVTDDGGSPIIACGVCWSTDGTPTIEGNHTVNSMNNDGTFTSIINTANWEPCGLYHFRSYATNSNGTSYSDVTMSIYVQKDTLAPYIQHSSPNQSPYTRLLPVRDSNCTYNAPSKEVMVNALLPQIHDDYTDMSFDYLMNHAEFYWENTNISAPDQSDIFSAHNHLTIVVEVEDQCGNELNDIVFYMDRPNDMTSITSPSVISSDTTLCSGNTVVLTFDSSKVEPSYDLEIAYPLSFEWICLENDVFFSNANSVVTVVTPNHADTTYHFQMKVTDRYGCAAYSETHSVHVSDSVPLLPTVTTDSVFNITANSASCGGEVTCNGGAPVSARGVCWSTEHNPMIIDSHTNDGYDTGSFTSNIMDLAPNTTYYVRAYATNQYGTAYGDELSFTTPCPTINIIGPSFIHLSGNITLTASGADNYFWSTGDSSSTITVIPNGTVTYSVTGTDSYGCVGSASKVVTTYPSINPTEAGTGLTNIEVDCNNPSVTLCANVIAKTTTDYTVESIPFNPPFDFTEGTRRGLDFDGIDDRWGSSTNLPFCFSYYGRNYTHIVPGSNSVASFGYHSGECNWRFSDSIPSSNLFTNTIFACYRDIDTRYFGTNGGVFDSVYGEWPNRCYKLSFNNIGLFNDNAHSPTFSSMIVLYEGTNIIEIYLRDAPTNTSWNNGNGVLGLQNFTGTKGITPPGRNTGPWTAHEEAWRFIPVADSNYTVTWYLGTDTTLTTGIIVGTGDTITVFPQESTDYTARLQYTNDCGDKFILFQTCHVTVNREGPIVTVNASQNELCEGDNTTLTATGADTYFWSTGDEGSSITVYPTTTTTYYVTGYSGAECSSIDSITVTVWESVDTVIFVAACESYTWNDYNYYISGEYVQHFQTVHGCDSMVTLHLTINHSANSTIHEIACNSFAWNDTIYYNSGQYEQYFQTVHGCDSTVTLLLTVHYSYDRTLFDTVLENNLPYFINGLSLFETGMYIDTMLTVNYCDSIVTLYLTVLHNVQTEIDSTICSSQLPFIWNDSIYMRSGDYTQQFSTVLGSDSIVTLHLTVLHSDTTEFDQMCCYHYTWNGITYSATGDYSQTLSNQYGCDSLVIMHLTIYDTVSYHFSIEACGQYMWNGSLYTSSGDYTQTFMAATGCDSIVTLHLTINPIPEVVITGNTIICPGGGTMLTANGADSYLWSNGSTNSFISVNVFGIYSVTGTSAAGCFNTASATVLVAQPPVITISGFTDLCAGDTTIITAHGGTTYLWSNGSTDSVLMVSDAGVWQVIGYDENGCNSMANVNVNIWQPYISEFSVNVCNSYTWNDLVYTLSGDYTQNFQMVHGCDSVVTLHLTVNQPTSGDTTAVACDSFTWQGITYTESNDYTTTLTNATGCDSVVTLHLTITNTDHTDFTDVACDSYTWNGETYTASGDYTQTFTNAAGCDSVVTLHLTIMNTDHTNFTDVAYDSYMWNGETYTASGDYTQTFTNAAGCDSVVTLHLTLTVGLNDHDGFDFKVYPNPTNNIVNVECIMTNEELGNAELHLCDAYGRLLEVVWANNYSPLRTVQIDLSRYANGVYFVKLIAEDKTIAVRKVVKQ